MTIVGSTVIIKPAGYLGTIIGHTKKRYYEGYYDVRAWNSDKKEYIEKEVHPNNLEVIRNTMAFRQTNMDYGAGYENALDVQIELALEMGNEEWFKELTDEKKKRELRNANYLLEEEDRILPGRSVVDMKGNNIGVVICKKATDDNQFYIWGWSEISRKYWGFYRRVDLVQAAESPKWSRYFNPQDREGMEIARQVMLEAAVDNNDKEWFEQLCKQTEKEMSDGA